MSGKKSFVLFTDRKKEIDLLSDAQCGTLFKAILQYADTGERLESDDLVVQVLFSVFASQMDGCAEKWEDAKRKRAEAGRKGGIARWNNANPKQTIAKDSNAKQTIAKDSNAKQRIAKQAVTVTDTVTGTVTVSVNKNPAEAAPKGASPSAGKDAVVPWDAVDFDLV